MVHQYEVFDTINRRPRSGHPGKSNEREEDYLVQYTRRYRETLVPSLRHHFQRTFPRTIATLTFRRRL